MWIFVLDPKQKKPLGEEDQNPGATVFCLPSQRLLAHRLAYQRAMAMPPDMKSWLF
jgi:hypothetical protein